MDAVKFLKEKKRMCISSGDDSCHGCPIYAECGILTCAQFQDTLPNQTVKIVEKWAREHPRETRKDDFFEKKDDELHNKIEWIIPNAQKNEMEPIRLTLEPYGSIYPDLPHEGEEFGYVLSGQVKIHLGQKVHQAKKGDAFYFTPSKKHYLEAGKHGAVVIWVTSPPSF